MKPAVLIIDMQKDFFRKERLLQKKNSLISNINSLAAVARDYHIPVIWVRQEMKADLSDAPLNARKAEVSFVVEGTEGSQLLEGMHKEQSDREIIKKRYSPFYETGLHDLLKQLHVDTLILAGINTHACVRMAAIDAFQRDYEVILATDCADSYDEEHHNVSVTYLSRSIAQVMTNEEIRRAIQAV